MKKLILLIFSLNSFFVLGQLSFVDSATSLNTAVSYGDSEWGGGVSFVDFNNDGWDDITYSTQSGSEIYFFVNNQGTFSQTTLTGISNTHEIKQVIWVDYDNDGDKDFFATSLSGLNKMYKNDGNLSFTDVTATCGFFTENLNTYGASFADIDNDGDLDAFIANRDIVSPHRNYLYRNDNGVFVDISASSGINLGFELSFCVSFFDYDNDGDQDIYLANDKLAHQNRFYRNNGDLTFTDVSAQSNTDITIDAMSTTIGDYNNDGWFDIYITNTFNGNVFFKNNGDGTFTDVATSTGTEFNSVAWGAVFLDADNDSNLDLYVSGMLDGSNPNHLSAAFYYNDGTGNFSIPANIGLNSDNRESFANAIGDIDNDGDPDIIVMNDTDNNFLWKNETSTSNNWLKIKLEGVTSNKDGIGNKIEISANGKSQYRYTLCGEGFLGQNSSYEFIGVADATQIDFIKITWNKTGIVETINNVAVNQAITVKEGLGILNVEKNNLTSFSVYPNPSNTGVYKINTQLDLTNFKVTVNDVLGRKIPHQLSLDTNTVDISNAKQGIYLITISSENINQTIKVLKE